MEWPREPAARSFAVVSEGAATPEELETLFEDAFVVRDAAGLCALFGAGGVLVRGEGPEARGPGQIAAAAEAIWRDGRTYVGGSPRVLQAGELGLLTGRAGIHVVRRDPDGAWRMAIALLDTTTRPAEEAA